MDVTLSTLIEVHGEKTKKLSFRAPQAGDLRGIKLSLSGDGLSFETATILDLAAKLADVPPSTMNALPLHDVIAIAAQIAPLLGGLEKALMQSSQSSSSPAASAPET